MAPYMVTLSALIDADTPEAATKAIKRLLATIPRYAGFNGAVEFAVGEAREVVGKREAPTASD